MRSHNATSWRFSPTATALLLSPFNLLAALGMDMYLPVVPRMADALGTGAGAVQLTLTVYLVLLGAGQLLFGPLSDRLGRRPVLLGGGLLFLAASFGLALASSSAAFLALRVAQACGASACMVVAFATVRDLYAGRDEGSAVYGLLGALLAVVPAVGPLLGALVDGWAGWRAIFVLLGAGMLAALAAAWVLWPETRARTATGVRPAALLQPLRSRRFGWYMLGYSAGMGAFFVFFSISPWLMMGRLGLSQVAFSALFATVALSMIASARVVGRMAPRWGMRRSLQGAMACLVAAGLLLGAGELFAPRSVAALIAPMWLAGAGIAAANAVAPNGAMRGFDGIAGTATALFFCLGGVLLGTAGTVAATLLPRDTHWPVVAYCLALPLCVLAVSWRARNPEPGTPRPGTE